MIKNLSQLKRELIIDSGYTVIENALKPEVNGEDRTIVRTQTNAVVSIRNNKEYFLDWQKAKNTRFNDDGTIDFLFGEKVNDNWLIEEQSESGKDYWLKIKLNK